MTNPIQIGDKCPIFSLPNQVGEVVNISDYLGKQKLVLFFYPKDDTPGCTKEACEFRDRYADFLDLGCTVFGISSDSESSHVGFIQKHSLPYSLLADKQKIVRKLFGVPGNLFWSNSRKSYVYHRRTRNCHWNFQFSTRSNWTY